jgi:uncharacterized membrane protein
VTGQFRPLISSALAGAASGARSFTGFAVLAQAASGDAAAQPDRTLGRPWVKATAGLLAVTEIVLDKLPNAPSRLAPPGLASRMAGAAASGAVIARRASRDDSPPAPAAGKGSPVLSAQLAACVATSVGAAATTSWLGAQWRAWAAPRFGRDWAGAVIEDAVALTLAAVAAREAA